MACGNNKVDRSMIASMGGLAVTAAVAATADRVQALARLVGRPAVTSQSMEYYVLSDGSRVVRTDTQRDGRQHVHVVREHRGQPNTAMMQITLKDQRAASFPEGGSRVHDRDRDATTIDISKDGSRRGHFERIEVWTPSRPLRDADLRTHELSLVEEMKRRGRRSKNP